MQLISYNIQATIHTTSYWAYSYQWPRQILPTPGKKHTRQRIAAYIDPFDIACLQEIDLGGLRNGFKSHVDQFRHLTHFTHSCAQTNRKIIGLSAHGNLILSKQPLKLILDSPLPGKISGRGILAAEINGIVIANTHLSLGNDDQIDQLHYIHDQLAAYPNVILCGDFNALPDSPPLHALERLGWHSSSDHSPTFPSWQPNKRLDHILYKGDLTLHSHVGSLNQSDHLPLIADIEKNK